MNRENILAVADAIEKHSIPDLGFNMVDYLATSEQLKSWEAEDHSGHNCGTTGCIAGWAVAVEEGGLPEKRAGYKFFEQAADFLGLSDRTSNHLFLDYPSSSLVKPKHAVSVLRHLAETGEVDWDRALAEPSK